MMRAHGVPLLACALAVALPLPAAALEPLPLSIDRYLQIRGQVGAAIAPDGSAIAYIDRATGVPEAWVVPAAGGWPAQITFFGERVQAIHWSPYARDRLIVERDVGGSERSQLFLLDPTGANLVRLTGDDRVIHGFGGFAPDGHTIAYRSNARDEAYFDLYLLDLETGAARRVLEQDGMNAAAGFSPDGKQLLVVRTTGADEDQLLALELASGAARPLTPESPPARHASPHWSSDGRAVYLLTDCGREFMSLARLDVTTGQLAFLRDDPWDAEALAVSADGRRLALVLDADGVSKLVLLDLETGTVLPSPPMPAGVILDLDWTPDGRRLALTLSNARSPGTIATFDPEPAGAPECGDGALWPVTRPVLAGIPPGAFVEPRVVSWPSFDGRTISGFFYAPAAPASARPPCLAIAHGGPAAQSRPSFNVLAQYYAAHGCAVFLPNVRGSTGYGRTFMRLDDGERREDAVADLERGVAWLARQGLVDSARVAIHGRSYGGYVTLAALTLYPERWAAGVEIAGISNFVTFLEQTGAYRRRHREAEYGSLEHDRSLLERLSPIHRVDRIRAPLLVVHGSNDPRVPIGEAEQMVEALRARGRPVEFLRFADEGHALSRLDDRLAAYGAMARFLAAHLGFAVEDSVPRAPRAAGGQAGGAE